MSTTTTTDQGLGRLVARFPLNGDESMHTGGMDIFITNERTDDEQYVVVDRWSSLNGRAVMWTPDFGAALRRCLESNGWGQFEIKDVTS